MAKTIVVTNQKGGVGKTTTVVNLGYEIAKTHRVLIIDCDPQANCSSGLGVKPNEEKNLYQVVVGATSLEDAIVATPYPNLSLIPSHQDLIGFNIEYVQQAGRAKILKNLIAPLQANYDFILVDTPPSLELLTLNTMVMADSIFIPIQCEYYALEGISKLLKTIKQVKQTYHPKLYIEGLSLNMYDKRTKLSKEVVESVVHHFGTDVYKTIIPRNVKISEAPSYGTPIGHYAPQSLGARSYAKLAVEFLARNSASGMNSATPNTHTGHEPQNKP